MNIDWSRVASEGLAIMLSGLSAWWAKRAHHQVRAQPDDPTGKRANGNKTLRQEQARLAVMMGEHFGEEVWPGGPAHGPHR